jgi:hypothetical protein
MSTHHHEGIRCRRNQPKDILLLQEASICVYTAQLQYYSLAVIKTWNQKIRMHGSKHPTMTEQVDISNAPTRGSSLAWLEEEKGAQYMFLQSTLSWIATKNSIHIPHLSTFSNQQMSHI